MRPEELLMLLREFNAVNVFEHVARQATRRARPGAEQDHYYAWWCSAVTRWQALYEILKPFAYGWNPELNIYELEDES